MKMSFIARRLFVFVIIIFGIMGSSCSRGDIPIDIYLMPIRTNIRDDMIELSGYDFKGFAVFEIGTIRMILPAEPARFEATVSLRPELSEMRDVIVGPLGWRQIGGAVIYDYNGIEMSVDEEGISIGGKVIPFSGDAKVVVIGSDLRVKSVVPLTSQSAVD